MSDETDGPDKSKLLEFATTITASYVQGNQIDQEDVPRLLNQVYASLDLLAHPPSPPKDAPIPAIAIDESVTDEFIYCLEDGLPFKSLKRHLRTKYNLTPEAYREKWELPMDYPMVAPSYTRERAKIARHTGLGRAKDKI